MSKVLEFANEKDLINGAYVFSENIEEIGECSFVNARFDLSKIHSLDFTKSRVRKISNRAFFDIPELNVEYILLPNSNKEIGEESFWGLDGLLCIYIPRSVEKIGKSAIENCPNCIVLVEEQENIYGDSWYGNVKQVLYGITKTKLKEELIKIAYIYNDFSNTNEDNESFCEFTIDLFERFPKFEYNEELERPYIIAGAFVKYMEKLIYLDSEELDKCLNYIENLHFSDKQCIRELAIIGFVENIQNTWSEENKKFIYNKLADKTKQSWNDLNDFWGFE